MTLFGACALVVGAWCAIMLPITIIYYEKYHTERSEKEDLV